MDSQPLGKATLCLFAVLLATAVIAHGQSADESSEDPTFLAAVMATGGGILSDEQDRDCYKLMLFGADHITLFTDRPARQAYSLHAGQFVPRWSEAYGDDPPNASLQLFNADGSTQNTIVELVSPPSWDSDTMTMTFAKVCVIASHSDPQELRPADSFNFGSLFIDGAKLFSWNSCYSVSSDGDAAPYSITGACMEQWGSYPASCGKFANKKTASGKRCKNVCPDEFCGGNCFDDYDSGNSLKYLASYYTCD